MKDWMKDGESTDRKDSAVRMGGWACSSTAVITLPSRDTQSKAGSPY